jgi:hypothetical protein
MTSLLVLGLPLVIYLSLAVLPKGKPAILGLAVAGAMIMAAYVAAPGLGNLRILALGGVGLAALAQTLRWLAGPRLAAAHYIALLGALPLAALAAIMFSLGA